MYTANHAIAVRGHGMILVGYDCVDHVRAENFVCCGDRHSVCLCAERPIALSQLVTLGASGSHAQRVEEVALP